MVVSCLSVLIPEFPFRVVASTHTAASTALGLRGEATYREASHRESVEKLDTEPLLPAPGPGPFLLHSLSTFPGCELQQLRIECLLKWPALAREEWGSWAPSFELSSLRGLESLEGPGLDSCFATHSQGMWVGAGAGPAVIPHLLSPLCALRGLLWWQ